MKKIIFPLLIVMACLGTSCQKNQTNSSEESITQKPNIIFIYLDDLGYGDLGVNGAKGVETPHFDALANGGINFTNGYASSATCTPSRYAAFTGQYPWRKNAKILPGSAPMLIDTTQVTLAGMLKESGYNTAIIGKWHLGLGTHDKNWNEHIYPNPNDVGYHHSYIMAATQDRVPTVYIEDGDVVGLDPNDPIEIDYDNNFPGQTSGKENPELTTMKWHHGHNSSIINGIPRIGFMKGGKSAIWSDVDMADHFLGKVKNYITEKSKEDKPFFLTYTMQQPHVPRTPHPRFVGKSTLGPRGDVIAEADWCIGELMKTIREAGIEENTLIVLSSDNGPVLNDGYYDDAVEKLGDHDPNGGLRGGKYSLYDAGTHVPFITYWKGKIQPSTSNALVCQMDLFASLADLVGSKMKSQDSENVLPALLGTSKEGRSSLILEATTRTSYRKGDYVLMPAYEGPKVNTEVNIELGNLNELALFNLKEDPAQTKNIAKENPELVQQLLKEFISKRGKDYKKTSQLELK
ncbi:sulfatase-like hydrolase/transferase [Flammeovirga yaeyamensis]|uniref:Sulfatase-like hydrolase/transferase n=1 Tax=Flammeovirga yaeyamensis TaxID=367791 RepID=A0AAX1NBX8_9BACT|nr:arylsulfatase [Flammeovirga yaeyamensis]MBB3696992.1 arylsulfatase A-like enzyme [Flammeovirga yaeyamensis]NMF33655.1 arylsulfatase [Flammeovirga yaeyamensis]QWG05079.1 sulfatase-like hydrolase/transferase [Flammeovirga yaeyamensis]